MLIFKSLIVVIPIGLIAYIASLFLGSISYSDSYQVDLNLINFQNVNGVLYIAENRETDKLGAGGLIGDDDFREIVGFPLVFIWKPEKFLLEKKVAVSIVANNEAAWEVSIDGKNYLPFVQVEEVNSQGWARLTREFDIGADQLLKDDRGAYFIPFYLTVAEIEKSYKKLKQYKSNGFKEVGDVGDYVVLKRETAAAIAGPTDETFDFLRKQSDDEVILVSGSLNDRRLPVGWLGEKTNLVFNLREDHKFYLYLKDSLRASFTKRDLNFYEGEDRVVVSLINTVSGEVVCQTKLVDDGNSKADFQSNNISGQLYCDNLRPGVYSLEFKGSDYALINLVVNTNKILIADRLLNLDGINLYADNDKAYDLKLILVSNAYEQAVEFSKRDDSGFKRVLDFKAADAYKDIIFNLFSGSWLIKVPQGNIEIRGGLFALAKENWFDVDKFIPDLVAIKKSTNRALLNKFQVEVK